jgi:preprotein translocase subunit SecE
MDVVKLLLALAVVVGGLYGFYQFADDYPIWARALGLLALIGVAFGIAATTQIGGKTLRFAADANLERRKVVWPTRQETLQTTLIVIVAVIIVSILLWLTDSFFGWVIRALLGY